MKLDEKFVEGFVKQCYTQGLTDEEILDAYTIYCGKTALGDKSFRSGFSDAVKSASLPDKIMDTTDIQRVVGHILINELLNAQ